MDLKDQLQKLFPDHEPLEEEQKENNLQKSLDIWIAKETLVCKYEKRNGKPITIIENYSGAEEDYKNLTKYLKKKCSVGGSFKNDTIIIQGNYREKIMILLQELGFKVKRVGG